MLLLLSRKADGANTTPKVCGQGPFGLRLSRPKTPLASNGNVVTDGNITLPDCVRHELSFGPRCAVAPVLVYHGIRPVFLLRLTGVNHGTPTGSYQNRIRTKYQMNEFSMKYLHRSAQPSFKFCCERA